MKLNKQFKAYLTEANLKYLNEIAENSYLNKSQLINKLIENYYFKVFLKTKFKEPETLEDLNKLREIINSDWLND